LINNYHKLSLTEKDKLRSLSIRLSSYIGETIYSKRVSSCEFKDSGVTINNDEL